MGADDVRSLLRDAARAYASERGVVDEEALNLFSDLILAFADALTEGERIPGAPEWMNIAFRAKKIPSCRTPCHFSSKLESVLSMKGFNNPMYLLALSRMGSRPPGG